MSRPRQEWSDAPLLRERDRLLLAISAEHPAGRLVPVADGTLEARLGELRLRLVLAPRVSAGGGLNTTLWTLTYQLEGPVESARAEVRELVLQVATRVGQLESERGRPLDLERIAPRIEALHRSNVSAFAHGPALRWRGLPPCLELDQRPPWEPALPVERASALAQPCSECARARECADARSSEPEREHEAPTLVPLRHASERAALDAAMDAIAAHHRSAVPEAARRFVERAFAQRRLEEPALHQPLELSLKLGARGLARTLRIVDYGMARSAPRSRAAYVVEGFESTSDRASAAAARDFVDQVLAGAPSAPELSLGIEAALDPDVPHAIQLYAHLDPRDPTWMNEVLVRLLRFAGSSEGWIRRFESFSANPIAAHEGARPLLTLACHSPTPDDPRRIKAYFSVPLALDVPEVGLPKARLGALAEFAPRWGLAVFESGRGEVRLRKHDFPSTAHPQSVRRVVRAFAAGLDAETSSGLETLLDGTRFTPWSTWLSVSRTGRTIYFVPR